MKHWHELVCIEDELIEIEMLLSNVKSLSCAINEGLHIKDIQNCIFMIEQKMEMISNNANESFENLWENILNEEQYSDELNEMMNDGDTVDELTDIMNSWVKSN